jgi:hypothetical protein
MRGTATPARPRASAVDMAGSPPDGSSFGPAISADGRSVAYVSGATDLVAGDGNGLRALANHPRAQRAKKLTPAQADQVVARLSGIRAALGCA